MVYEQYAWKSEYEGVPITYGGFAIIPGVVEDRPAVCIKQRNGKGGSPHQFDLPGGGMRTDPHGDSVDTDLGTACIREAVEEVGVRCFIKARIGQPLYLPVRKDGALVKVDCAQAFLVETQDTPRTSEEALAVAFVHQQSFAGFNVVSRKVDPTSPVFGRTPVMIWDGLSVLQPPFTFELLTDELRASIIGNPMGFDYVLVDGGAYLGLPFTASKPGKHDDEKWYIKLYHRLNPDQPDGRFHGAFD